LSELIQHPSIATRLRDLSQVDNRLQRFNLTEEQLLFSLFVSPIKQKLFGDTGYSVIARLTPDLNFDPNVVDELILFNTVARPLRIEGNLPCF
jgi:hypothetical protein